MLSGPSARRIDAGGYLNDESTKLMRKLEKATLLLIFNNQHNKAKNRCFILVEYHYTLSRNTWINLMTLTDVYENSKYGDFSGSRTDIIQQGGTLDTQETANTCEVYGKKCATKDEFTNLIRTYLFD